jgi:citrate lyase subunit beta/citryl-CoA lyase
MGLPADAFILDLEDSVPLPEKENARAGVKAYAPKVADHRVWVRVNGFETGLADADLDAVIGVKGIAGIFLPKVETRDDVVHWDRAIAALEKARGLAIGSTRLVLSIESALGVLNAFDMSTAASRVASLSFGGAQDGDLNNDLGCTWSSDGPEMMTARGMALIAARAARFDSPLDGVFADVRDPEGFAKDTALSRRLGYRGRKLIHPSQIEPCNRLYAPSQKELDYYTRVLEAFDKALTQGSASTTVDGKMIDVAMANAARRVLNEAAARQKAGGTA